MPPPPRAAASTVALVRPVAPRSCRPTSAGSRPQLQAGLDEQLLQERVADLDDAAVRLARVRRARRTSRRGCRRARCRRRRGSPGCRRRCAARPSQVLVADDPDAHRVDERVAVVGRVDRRPRRRPSARRRSCRTSRCPPTTPFARWRERAPSSEPKRRVSSSAIGRAPIVKMSRRMPPTPVAAPWNGSTALGWLWLSTLMTTGEPVADVDRAGVLLARARAGPAAPSVGKRRRSARECL